MQQYPQSPQEPRFPQQSRPFISPNMPLQQPYQPQPSWLEVERTRAALGKSYTTPAVITMLLYLTLWLPGFIVNLVYLSEASKTRKLTGIEPEGAGCLWAVLIVFNLPALLFLVVYLFFIIASVLSLL